MKKIRRKADYQMIVCHTALTMGNPKILCLEINSEKEMFFLDYLS